MGKDTGILMRYIGWMIAEAEASADGFVDFDTGEVSATALAEHAIWQGQAPETAFDDETHAVWDAAVDAADELERRRVAANKEADRD